MVKTQLKDLGMTMRFEKVPQIGHGKMERFKITLLGQHTLEEKMMMTMKAFAMLEHHRGIYRASASDLWLAPIDEHNCPLAFFGDGQPIKSERLLVDNPYACAADIYNCR
jgi:hypothetical protein